MRPLGDDVDLGKVGRYRSLPEMEAAFLALPGARASVDGTTHEGRAIRRIELGDPAAPRASLVVAGLHAMEWIGVETALAIAEDFIAYAPVGRRLILLPLQNPDGYARAEGQLRAGLRRFTRTNARGVDLNRNFPTHFRPWHLRAELFPFLGGPGAAPGSEPETRVILKTLARERARIDRAVSLHSFGRKLLLPFGGRWAPPDDIARLRALAREVNDALRGAYEIRTTSRWLPGAFAFGMELDHLQAEGITPLLVECSAGGWQWRDPSTWLHPFRWFNPPDPRGEASAIARALRDFLDPPDVRSASHAGVPATSDAETAVPSEPRDGQACS